MDAKDLRTETTQRSNDGSSKFAQSGPALPCNTNKTFDHISSNPLAKVETPTSRPCAVIGPDRIVPPPPTGDGYLKKGHYEPWPPMDNAYRQPPEYPHKMPSYLSPLGNISPRQTFQENMPRIMVQPTYSKVKDDTSYPLDRNLSKTSKVDGPAEPKYCDVPYTVNQISNDQKAAEMCVPNVNNARNYPQMWHPAGVNMRPSRPYGAPEMYQYPEYTSCAVPRPVPMSRPHRTISDEPGHVYSDPYYHENNIRFKPYPNVKDRYPQARYEYVNNNYTNPFHPPHPFPPYKYDMQKPLVPHQTHSQVPMKYIENRMADPVLDGYQRPPQGPYVPPYRNQVIHPTYGPMIGNNLPNKMYPYPPEGPVKQVASNKLPYDNKLYVEYDPARNKGYPMAPDSFYDMRQHMKNQVIIPNFPAANMQPIHPPMYYRKDNLAAKNFEYISHLRHVDPTFNHNSLTKLSSQFSPSSIAISPSDSNTSNDTAHTQGGSLEDCGYVSQSSTASIRSVDSAVNRAMHHDFIRRFNYPYPSAVRTSPLANKPDLGGNVSGSKNKKGIDVRQFFQMWNEGDDENGGNSKEVVPQPDYNTNKPASQYEVAKSNEQLYVLGLMNVPSEELGKYEHIQKVSKLPENIKGYNNIELLKHFEEAIESSNLNHLNTKSNIPRNYHAAAKIPLLQALPPRPLSPLDVEAKISQSVIHKEVGCNFEIKPCSPEMLNVQVATPAQNILNERTIEKVTNPLVIQPPLLSGGSGGNVMKQNDHSLILNENNKNASCKMINTQCSNSDATNVVKTNYSLQDLESNAGVCLASLPRLDNDIELTFPEVNQQFINANKESVITTADSNNDHFIPPDSGKDQESTSKSLTTSEPDKEFCKLSKYRKNKRNDGTPMETELKLNSQSLRTDSVIIKNPDNIKSIECAIDNQTFDKKRAEDLRFDLTAAPNNHSNGKNYKEDFSNEMALDFSLNKISNNLNVSSEKDDFPKILNKRSFHTNSSNNLTANEISDKFHSFPSSCLSPMVSPSDSINENYVTQTSASLSVENIIGNEMHNIDSSLLGSSLKECSEKERVEIQFPISQILDTNGDNLLNNSDLSSLSQSINSKENTATKDEPLIAVAQVSDSKIDKENDTSSFRISPIISLKEYSSTKENFVPQTADIQISEKNGSIKQENISSYTKPVIIPNENTSIENIEKSVPDISGNTVDNIKYDGTSSKISPVGSPKVPSVEENVVDSKQSDESSNELPATISNEYLIQENNTKQSPDLCISENIVDSKQESAPYSMTPTHSPKEYPTEENNETQILASDTSKDTVETRPNYTSPSISSVIIPNEYSIEEHMTQLLDSHDLENIVDSNASSVSPIMSSKKYSIQDVTTKLASNFSQNSLNNKQDDILSPSRSFITNPDEYPLKEDDLGQTSCTSEYMVDNKNDKNDSHISISSEKYLIEENSEAQLPSTQIAEKNLQNEEHDNTTSDTNEHRAQKSDTEVYSSEHNHVTEISHEPSLGKTDLNGLLTRDSHKNVDMIENDAVISKNEENGSKSKCDENSDEAGMDIDSQNMLRSVSPSKEIYALENNDIGNKICETQLEDIITNKCTNLVTLEDNSENNFDITNPSLVDEIEKTFIVPKTGTTTTTTESEINSNLDSCTTNDTTKLKDDTIKERSINAFDICDDAKNSSLDTSCISSGNNITKNHIEDESVRYESDDDKKSYDEIHTKSKCSSSMDTDRIANENYANEKESESYEINENKKSFISSNVDEHDVMEYGLLSPDNGRTLKPELSLTNQDSMDFTQVNETDIPGSETDIGATQVVTNYDGSVIDVQNDTKPIYKQTNIRKELFSPWIQNLILGNEGKCKNNTISESQLDTSEVNENDLIQTQNEHPSNESTFARNESEQVLDNQHECNNICSPKEVLERPIDNSRVDIIKTYLKHDNTIEEFIEKVTCPDITITADSGIYEIDNETSIIENSDSVIENEDNLVLQVTNNIYCDEDSIEKSLNQIHSDYPLQIENKSIKGHASAKRCLKRSLSDSALDSYKNESESFHSKKKQRKNNAFLNVFNIQNNRRNSISSGFNEENMSFCILIGNNCIISEENEEEEKICYDVSEQCFTTIHDDNVGDMDSASEVLLCPEVNTEEYVEPLILEDTDEKHFEESWVDDVACVETVVSDDIAEDIVISAPSSPGDMDESDDDESNIFNCEHTEKVKYIYGDKMCTDDAELVETLYRTPQMDVNRTLINREPHSSDDYEDIYENDPADKILSESQETMFEQPKVNSILDTNFDNNHNNDSENSRIENYSPPLISEPNHVETYNSPSTYLEKTHNDNENSCESSTDDMLFMYKDEDDTINHTAFSSPEVSSTTTEEKNSTILLKITNYKGTRISHLSDVTLSRSNNNSCRFTENVNYASYQSNSTKPRPLITKAAQKYIPPPKETVIDDLKVKLPLPRDSLMKYKQLKISRNERLCNANMKKDIQKKPKPRFEDVLKSIDEIQFQKHKEKSKKPKKSVPKVVIKKNENGSHYASTPTKETFNPDLTGRKWQPWVFIEKNIFIDKMASRKKTKAIFNHRKNTYVFADKFKKYKSIPSAKFVISKPKLDDSSSGQFKYTIRLKHSY